MSADRKPDLDALERRFLGAKRVGLFGHRAVGKTTLLAMLYREASDGRVDGVRLAALEPRGAEYLAEKIGQIEAGESPAGTLTETELRLRLYRGLTRIDLVLKDYQGEHVGLGSEAPIQEFLADCDAVLFCLDPEGSPEAADRRRRQQEVEQLLERYIDASDQLNTNRPIAVLVTKYDRVLARGGPRPEEVDHLVQSYYGMTRHALQTHVPRSTVFAVSSFGPEAGDDGRPPAELHPWGFDGVLTWLADQLEQSDREQLEWLWDLAPEDYPRLRRCVAKFEKRYPQSPRLLDYRRRLGKLGRRRAGRSLVRVLAGAAALVAGVAAYDAVGYHLAVRHERNAASAASTAARWQQFLAWHPTQPLFWPGESRQARLRRDEWRVKAAQERAEVGGPGVDPEVRAEIEAIREEAPRQAPAVLQVERTLEAREHDRAWRQIQAEALLPSKPASERQELVRDFVHKNPGSPHLEEALQLAAAVGRELAEAEALTDRGEVDRLKLDADLPEPDFPALIERGRRFLEERPGSRYLEEVTLLVEGFSDRLDRRDFDAARRYELESADRNFDVQLRKYQDYLLAHLDGGAHVAEARQAIGRITGRRDAVAYRRAFDHAAAHPNDVPEVAQRLRDYLNQNPEGRYAAAARAYVDWWERIQRPADYHVTLKRATVDPKFTKSMSGGGPNLSVSVWVGSTEYGPSPVIPDSTSPSWDYTFPQAIRWRAGDPVTIQLVDHDWSDSVVATLRSARDDRLALRNLSTEVRPNRERGRVAIEFESDFRVPALPTPAD